MKTVKTENFIIQKPIKIKDFATKIDTAADEKKTKKELKKTRKKLGELQDTMYAHGKYAVLICIQGMDTAGKDSMIREVFKDFNVRGINVHSFKTPTKLELKHDFLWRHYVALPERGKFGIFNRTHYENVLVTRVHPEYILNENLPNINSVDDIDAEFWTKRFDQINAFEKHVAQNGTIIFKFFLHLSKKEQKHRLIRRLEIEEKNWKFSPGDLDERKLWETYQLYYEDAINKTSTAHAPWFIVPADDKDTARLIVAEILHETLKQYKDIKAPEMEDEHMNNISNYLNELKNE